MPRLLFLIVHWILCVSALASRPGYYAASPDEFSGPMPIVATLAFFAMLWATTAENVPLAGYARKHPVGAIALVVGVPVGVGLLFG